MEKSSKDKEIYNIHCTGNLNFCAILKATVCAEKRFEHRFSFLGHKRNKNIFFWKNRGSE
jgi:hypothetical protein